ncbi:chromatin associated protein KTI12 [Stereum hirsutum FP-91666 SS1]|uniref:chromatin associated protein KTI12 n=1 Tax=Stereum hirsutum (strain FP-91666) TaxID=721885 RepID=UPI0004449711|nr:chromatin associated protein KTI12 [Stereum hirsutum FP-91666 SS1]EIM82814.1 chromatin associated protein KTI12 [Stereum hirsutum FP-91666 SS1]
MALITISGYPCSGKTRRAEMIKVFLEDRLKDPSYAGPALKVVSISDDTLGLDRSAYDDSRSEKPARGALFTAMQRQMGQDTLLIVDGMNYIKGFRYQMYCAAREFKLRVCTVHVVAPPESCKRWNEERQDGKAYKPETLENLIQRYEEPSSMVRWDSPLITVLWEDEVPTDQIWKAVMEGNVKPPNAGTQAVAKAPSSALHTLEQTTTALLSLIISSPSSGGPTTLTLPNSDKTPSRITISMPPRTVTLSELQRLKRQFVTVHKKAITLGTVEKGSVDWSEESVARKFGVYLEENLRG